MSRHKLSISRGDDCYFLWLFRTGRCYSVGLLLHKQQKLQLTLSHPTGNRTSVEYFTQFSGGGLKFQALMPCFTYWASIHCWEHEPPELWGLSLRTVGRRVQHVNNTAKAGHDNKTGLASWSFPAGSKGTASLEHQNALAFSPNKRKEKQGLAAVCSGRVLHVWMSLFGQAYCCSGAQTVCTASLQGGTVTCMIISLL